MFLKSKFFSLLLVLTIAGVMIFSIDSASAQVAGLTTSSVKDIIVRIINFLLSVAAGLAILFLIIGGIYYVTAGGNDQQMTTAKSMLTYAVIGLVFILISYSIVITVNNFITG